VTVFGSLPRHHYGAIYADPPWRWKAYSAKGEGRGAVAHYNVMTLGDLRALPVADLAAPDCALFLWSIDSMLPEALALIEAWGFTYKTIGFCWAKPNTKSVGYFIGLGYWTRANTELCLLATLGKPKRLARDVRRLIVAPRREHSRKPDEARAGIERLVAGPYLEMFARESAPGWDTWGHEAELFDQGPVETRRQPSSLAAVV
jgi:N6-adenosine-specific RNA methylase IME4